MLEFVNKIVLILVMIINQKEDALQAVHHLIMVMITLQKKFVY